MVVLVDGPLVSRWKQVLLERLRGMTWIELQVRQNGEGPSGDDLLPSGPKYGLFRLYWRLDRRYFATNPDPFGLVDIAGSIRREQDPDDPALPVDLVLQLGSRPVPDGLREAARHGVWYYEHGDTRRRRGGPGGFWEVMGNEGTVGSALMCRRPGQPGPEVLFRSHARTDLRSTTRSRSNSVWKSVAFVPRMLDRLAAIGEERFHQELEASNPLPVPCDRPPADTGDLSNLKLIMPMLGYMLRNVQDLVSIRLWLDQWSLLYHVGPVPALDFGRFRRIVPPSASFYADPFVVKEGNSHWIFFEEWIYSRRKGHISVLEIGPDGSPGTAHTVLDRPYHLSYPFVFQLDGQYYMIPETRANHTIELYRCTGFPDKWCFVRNLMENLDLVDATPFQHQGKWWLFGNIASHPGASSMDELHLFHTEDLLSGQWLPHPMNPVVSDVRKARPAGKVFMRNGSLIRPSQNSSRLYGYGIKLNRITELTTTTYTEMELDSLEPHWDRSIIAMHTLNFDGELTVIDGMIRRSRFS